MCSASVGLLARLSLNERSSDNSQGAPELGNDLDTF